MLFWCSSKALTKLIPLGSLLKCNRNAMVIECRMKMLVGAVGIVCHMASEASQTSPGFELRDQFVVAFCLHRPDANMVSNAACVVKYVTFVFFGNMEDFL